MTAALRLVVALACGTIFGLGLALSGMLDPSRVRGFLDVFGAWDPSLAFVLAGAVASSFVGVRLSQRMRAPLVAATFDLPSKTAVDARLIGGSALFGVGWGLSGLCPGPAIAASGLGFAPILVFTAAMIAGMALFAWLDARRRLRQTERGKKERPIAVDLF